MYELEESWERLVVVVVVRSGERGVFGGALYTAPQRVRGAVSRDGLIATSSSHQ